MTKEAKARKWKKLEEKNSKIEINYEFRIRFLRVWNIRSKEKSLTLVTEKKKDHRVNKFFIIT